MNRKIHRLLALFEQALADANTQGHEGYRVKDLRAFNVVFG